MQSLPTHTWNANDVFEHADEACFLVPCKPHLASFLSLCGNNQELVTRRGGFLRFLRVFPGQGINTCMTIEEVVRDYIRETVKPLTPEKARIKSLQSGVERARQALQSERDRQRTAKELERRRKIQQG